MIGFIAGVVVGFVLAVALAIAGLFYLYLLSR